MPLSTFSQVRPRSVQILLFRRAHCFAVDFGAVFDIYDSKDGDSALAQVLCGIEDGGKRAVSAANDEEQDGGVFLFLALVRLDVPFTPVFAPGSSSNMPLSSESSLADETVPPSWVSEVFIDAAAFFLF